MKKIIIFFIIVIISACIPNHIKAQASAIDPRIGIVHVAGEYPDRASEEDFLLYGARDALNLGFQSIEIFIDPRVCRARPWGVPNTQIL